MPRPRRRKIHEPITSSTLCGQPAFVDSPSKDVKDKKAKYESGLRYERQIIRLVHRIYASEDVEIIPSPWIQFNDATGQQWAQPDIVILPRSPDKPILVIEIKLTWTSSAPFKLQNFYGPLAEHLWGRPCAKILVYKNSKGKRAHKNLLSIHDFLTLKKGDYRECKYV